MARVLIADNDNSFREALAESIPEFGQEVYRQDPRLSRIALAPGAASERLRSGFASRQIHFEPLADRPVDTI
jgi:hypothetical protein